MYIYSPYGSLNLTESSPVQTFTEPLTLLDVKSFGVMGDSDPQQDYLIETLFIPAAREQAEILQNRDLVQKQYDLALDGWPCEAIELRPHLVSVDLIRYRDSEGAYTTLTENTDYAVDISKQPGLVMPPYNASWPSFTGWPSSSVLIRFTAGISSTSVFWSDAGARIKTGMQLLISAWVNNRLPFTDGRTALQEYPFGARECMSYGRREVVR